MIFRKRKLWKPSTDTNASLRLSSGIIPPDNTTIIPYYEKISLNALCTPTIHGGRSLLSLRSPVIFSVQMGIGCQHLQWHNYEMTHTRQLLSPWNKAQLTLNGLYVVIPKAGGENLPLTPYTAPWGGDVAQEMNLLHKTKLSYFLRQINPLKRSKTLVFLHLYCHRPPELHYLLPKAEECRWRVIRF